MTLKHPLVVATFAALLGFGSSIAYSWTQTPTDVAVIAAKVENLEKAVVSLRDRIDQLMQMMVADARPSRR